MNMSRLFTIAAVKADDLKPTKSMLGVGNPVEAYVEIHAGGQTFRTSTQKGTTVNWTETFDVQLGPNDCVKFHVYDKHTMAQDLSLGEAVVQMMEIGGAGLTAPRPIKSCNGNTAILHVSILPSKNQMGGGNMGGGNMGGGGWNPNMQGGGNMGGGGWNPNMQGGGQMGGGGWNPNMQGGGMGGGGWGPNNMGGMQGGGGWNPNMQGGGMGGGGWNPNMQGGGMGGGQWGPGGGMGGNMGGGMGGGWNNQGGMPPHHGRRN